MAASIQRGDMVKRAGHGRTVGRTVGRVTGIDIDGQYVYVEWERPRRYTALTRRWEPVAALVKVEQPT